MARLLILLKRLREEFGNTLRSKILIFATTIILCVIISSFLIVSYMVSVEVKQTLEQELLDAKNVFEEFQRSQYQRLISEGKVMAELPSLKEVVQTNNPILISREARRFQELLHSELFVIVSRTGARLMIINQPAKYGRDLLQPAVIKEVLQGKELVSTFNHLDKIFQVASVPLKRGDEVIGLLSIGYEMDKDLALELKKITQSEITFLVNDRIIVSSWGDALLPELNQGLVRYLPSYQPPSPGVPPERGQEIVVGKERYLSLFTPISENFSPDLGICVIQKSLDQALGFMTYIKYGMILVALVAIVLSITITFFVSRTITNPLERLVEATQQVGAGRYDQPIDLTATGEVGVLAKNFNDMRISLSQHMAQLERTNRDLARRVKEVTSLQEVTNAIISSLNIHHIFSKIGEQLKKFIKFDQADVVRLDKEEGILKPLSSYPQHQHKSPWLDSFPISNTAMEKAVATKKPYINNQLTSTTPYKDLSTLYRMGERAVVIFPLLSEDKVLGLFHIGNQTPNSFSRTDLQILRGIIGQLSISLNNIILYHGLKESEERYRKLFGSVKEAVYQSNLDGVCLLINQAGAEVFGFRSSEEMIGVNFKDLYIDPADIDRFRKEIAKKGYVTNYLNHMKRRDGKEIWLEEASNYIRDEKGNIIGIEGIFRDVTERKRLERELQESEQFLRKVIENTTDAIFTLDDQGRLSFVNPRMEEITGYSQEEMRGRELLKLVAPAKTKEVARQLRITLEDGLPTIHYETEMIRKSGERITVLFSLAPLIEEDRTYNVIGTITDITHRVELEERLLQSERLASMGEIAAGFAHELNNPLGIVLGFANELLSETAPSDSRYKDLKIIEQETARCSDVVKDLLNFARPHPVEIAPTPIDQVIDNSLSLLKLQLKNNRIKLTKTISPNLPLVNVDRYQMQQVFINVIVNALQAMPQGGNLRIKAYTDSQSEPEAPPMVTIQISDTGSGIPEEYLSRVFDPFFSTKLRKGTGLGLTICQQIISAHKGKIEIKSQLGKGTECIIKLPVDSTNYHQPKRNQ